MAFARPLDSIVDLHTVIETGPSWN